jgi:hypothetical protein
MRLVLAAVLLIACVGQSEQANGERKKLISFEGVRPSYAAGQKVNFVVHSTATSAMFFSCAVEWFYEGKWSEVIGSVHNPNSKTVELYPLKVGQRKALALDLARVKPPLRPGRYRLRAEIYDPAGVRRIDVVFSAPLQVRPTK